VLGEDFAHLVAEGDDVLDDYGGESSAEFFAVATEAFFEKPAQMKARHPRLYAELAKYYAQDPAARLDPT
jgi:Mlc titration factor MtfA (ptsG expression regulator)